ncbi:hypothetical protein BFP72_16765 [Reichenbachiella sp. 5M10]|uniref:DUF4129 domain-containing protein n=1 Tax=Reichenbachiella sp. 5M10 TaxID=1889772 RepID=UPI000C15F317|nr:DUF4129 domain-containing protein [Reichenbachiella sp. 5M10]PIB36937.1 hypothetical protein BFP72_16765 [Reichenbachiella sp. 5M10]
MSRRSFDSKKLAQLQEEFASEYYSQEKSYGWYDRVSVFLDYWFGRLGSFFAEQLNWHIPPVVFEILFYGFMVGGMLYLILKILGIEMNYLLPFGKKKVPAKEYVLTDEDIEGLDFGQLIEEAKRNGNHLMVVRYYYLHALQILSDQELIQYEIRKTNREYLSELAGHQSRETFCKMTKSFEQIWYGHLPVSVEMCAQMEGDFQWIKDQLS